MNYHEGYPLPSHKMEDERLVELTTEEIEKEKRKIDLKIEQWVANRNW